VFTHSKSHGDFVKVCDQQVRLSLGERAGSCFSVDGIRHALLYSSFEAG
jgi:hypothetical protein